MAMITFVLLVEDTGKLCIGSLEQRNTDLYAGLVVRNGGQLVHSCMVA
jgi:hypothetical protein